MLSQCADVSFRIQLSSNSTVIVGTLQPLAAQSLPQSYYKVVPHLQMLPPAFTRALGELPGLAEPAASARPSASAPESSTALLKSPRQRSLCVQRERKYRYHGSVFCCLWIVFWIFLGVLTVLRAFGTFSPTKSCVLLRKNGTPESCAPLQVLP